MIDIEKVVSVYSGKPHRCCCGCSGKHTYASQHRSTVRRGYAVLDNEVNDRVVKTIVNKMNKSGKVRMLDEECFTVDTPTRVYIAYLKG